MIYQPLCKLIQMQVKRNRKANIELTENDIKVYEVVKQRKKCIIKDLKYETRFPSDYLSKILSILQAHKMVKSVKTFQFKGLNVWVLFDHPEGDYQQPSRTPQTKKSIQSIRQQKEQPKKMEQPPKKQRQQEAKMKEQPQAEQQLVQKGSVEDIELMNLIKQKTEITVSALEAQAIHKNISTINFNQILLIMELQGDIRLNGATITSRKRKTLQSPCISCHFHDLCHPDNVINPQGCSYLLSW